MIQARKIEIRNLTGRGTCRDVLKIKLPDIADMITARYVSMIKKVQTKKKRYVAGENLDIMKDYIDRAAKTIYYLSVHITLVVVKSYRFPYMGWIF